MARGPRAGSSHRPQCFSIFLITDSCGGSMNEMTFIVAPHSG